jgi:hypothetical protein
MLPVLAASGWACLYLWWQQGDITLLAACILLEMLSLLFLLSLLKHKA